MKRIIISGFILVVIAVIIANVYSDSSTLTPASLGPITKVVVDGEEKNAISINLNDADRVYMGTRCPGNLSQQDNSSYITREMAPEGYGVIFHYDNVGECIYKLRSVDQFGKDIPTEHGDLYYGSFILE